MAETDLDDDLAVSTTSLAVSEDERERSSDSDAASNLYSAMAVTAQPSALPDPASSPNSYQTSEVVDHMDSEQTAGITQEPPQRRQLNLLDLPVDILREITKEITHTNDLTSLALTCSALHSLAIPLMYSRFDIVWPETVTASEHPTGVDALSYGLATLVMGEHLFSETPTRPTWAPCSHCGCNDNNHQRATPARPAANGLGMFRFGNYYAQYTRKFSVGNGPPEWVQEYSITKETGKMMGTLVALAVARMVNLETFIWDMPTGVMRDVFIALSSLGNRPGHECRLDRVWIRWHDNSDNPNMRNTVPPVVFSPTGYNSLSAFLQRHGHVEHPTFSVLPPLKSLSVLDIDEPAYLEEMAVLIARSRHKLRELRIGLAGRASRDEWVIPTETRAQGAEPAARRITPGWPKYGGALSILLNATDSSEAFPTELPSGEEQITTTKGESDIASAPADDVHNGPNNTQQLSTTTQMLDQLVLEGRSGTGIGSTEPATPAHHEDKIKFKPAKASDEVDLNFQKHSQSEKIKLEVLELERVFLSTSVLLRMLDWHRLTTLTIFRCEHHESLWRTLRRHFSPSSSIDKTTNKNNYPLHLKHLQTDRVSPYLMLFLKETIAPNTLESIYLQESNPYESFVGIDAIYKHVLRRQRASLRKVLIDRSQHLQQDRSPNSGLWRTWMLPRAALSFVTSGRMPQLRELGIGMDRRDWHFFLQRLPNMSNLRALFLPKMDDPTLSDAKKHRELALQILDIVTLRPEIKLCYLGIEDKCFEIMETVSLKDRKNRNDNVDGPWVTNSEVDSELEEDDDDQVSDASHSDDVDDNESMASSDDANDGYSDEDEQNGVGSDSSKMTFKLREILFYDDKISIFKARYCRL